MKKSVFLPIVLILFFVNNLFAQKDDTKTKLYPRPPIYGIPAKTLPKGKIIYRSYFTFSDYTEMWNGTKMTDLPSGMNFQSYSYTPKFRYGLTKRITLIANIPLYYKAMSSSTSDKTGIGLCDVIVAGLYKFYHNKLST